MSFSVFFKIWKSKEFFTISLIVFALPLSFLSSYASGRFAESTKNQSKTEKDILPSEILSNTHMKDTTWKHSGSLPGTAAIMRRLDDTFTYVVLTNGRSNEKNFWTALSECGSNAIKLNKEWPAKNLFKEITW